MSNECIAKKIIFYDLDKFANDYELSKEDRYKIEEVKNIIDSIDLSEKDEEPIENHIVQLKLIEPGMDRNGNMIDLNEGLELPQYFNMIQSPTVDRFYHLTDDETEITKFSNMTNEKLLELYYRRNIIWS